MALYFVGGCKKRYKQFDCVFPYVSWYSENINGAPSCEYNEPIKFLDKLSKDKNKSIVVFDYESLEIIALNRFPKYSLNGLKEVGLRNLEGILKIRGASASHKTMLQAVFFRNGKINKVELNGAIDGTISIEDSSNDVVKFDDIFMPDYYSKVSEKLPVNERAITSSLGHATKMLIDFILENKLEDLLVVKK